LVLLFHHQYENLLCTFCKDKLWMMPVDRLGAISLFVKAVETGSFSEAGRQSGLSPSSVSRRIDELEAWVGSALFYRTTRKLTLTEAGRSFHQRTYAILLDLEEARTVAGQLQDHPSGLIRMTVPEGMEHHFSPAISDFQTQWPDVSFVVDFSARIVDLVGEGFDLAIRVGQMQDSTLRSRRIAAAQRYLCASEKYLLEAGTPQRPEDLEDHNCLIYRALPGYNVWRFKSGKAAINVRASGNFSANSGHALVNAARDGRGIILSPGWLVGPSLAKGDLVEILPKVSPNPARVPLYAVHPYRRFVPPKVKTFVDFLAQRFGDDYDWRR
jgi:DNA-binding transcriptional LysR family regulator